MRMRVLFFSCMAMMLFTALTGCSSTSAAAEYPQIPSYAISQSERTSLGAAIKDDVAKHPGKSGFRLLATGSESFAMRLALIQAAEKTLDLQYYSVHDDTTSNLLIEALVKAARRGVRIRFLLDNIALSDVDETFAVLDGMKNVEIRVFNPFATRDDGVLERMVRAVTDLGSMNHRMHNKALIGDNQFAIIGGRNLGDEYFEEHTDWTFRDLDILSAGPVTAQISKSFDRYWNSKDAIPLGQLRERDNSRAAEIRMELAANWEEVRRTEKGKKLLSATLAERLKDSDVKLIWAPAELVADPPQKIDDAPDEAASKPMMRLDQLLDRADEEFIAVSSYFVPRKDGVEWLTGLAQRMRVRILTNSLASTDVVAVHAGYRRYREELVKNGVELYEMKPIGGERPRQRLVGSKAPARASLHSKVYVVDRREVMIGSFNLDPRSIELNTEVVLVIHSPVLATQLVKMFDEVASPETSYEVVEDGDGLAWKAREKGGEVRFGSDPHPGFWRSIEADLFSLLPLEDQL